MDDQWKHAISAEAKFNKKALQAQYFYMRDLFYNFLPLGENTATIDKTFSVLESVIFTKDGHPEAEVGFDEFPSEPECDTRDYKYYSYFAAKEHGSRPGCIADGEKLAAAPNPERVGDQVQSDPEVVAPIPRLR